MRQDINKSYEDSEKDNFIYPTSNTPKSTKERIAKKYADITVTQPYTGFDVAMILADTISSLRTVGF